jgi:hypothetical protein
LALTPLALRSSDNLQERNSLLAPCDRLLATGCQPERFDAAMAIAARVLRDVTYARAGMPLASDDLGTLQARAGPW